MSRQDGERLGSGAIMHLHRPSKSHEQQYAIARPCERVWIVFHITRDDHILLTFGTVEQAEQILATKAADT